MLNQLRTCVGKISILKLILAQYSYKYLLLDSTCSSVYDIRYFGSVILFIYQNTMVDSCYNNVTDLEYPYKLSAFGMVPVLERCRCGKGAAVGGCHCGKGTTVGGCHCGKGGRVLLWEVYCCGKGATARISLVVEGCQYVSSALQEKSNLITNGAYKHNTENIENKSGNENLPVMKQHEIVAKTNDSYRNGSDECVDSRLLLV